MSEWTGGRERGRARVASATAARGLPLLDGGAARDCCSGVKPDAVSRSRRAVLANSDQNGSTADATDEDDFAAKRSRPTVY